MPSGWLYSPCRVLTERNELSCWSLLFLTKQLQILDMYYVGRVVNHGVRPFVWYMEGVSAKIECVALHIRSTMKVIFLQEDLDLKTELRTKDNHKRTCCEWFDFLPAFPLNYGNYYYLHSVKIFSPTYVILFVYLTPSVKVWPSNILTRCLY